MNSTLETYQFIHAEEFSQNPSAFDEEALLSNAETLLAYVIMGSDAKSCCPLLKHIRQQTNPQIYLRPVIAIYDSRFEFVTNDYSFDFVFDSKDDFQHNASLVDKTVIKINNWIKSIPHLLENLEDTSVRFKVLRFISSRQLRLVPSRTAIHKVGYIYPEINAFFDHIDSSITGVLSYLMSQQLIAGEFVEKVHACPSCESVFLNFKEICPACSSPNIVKDDLIHHFSCGYTGASEKFSQNGQKICPKCGETLHHIGVDYDKPSSIHTCRSCSHTFQEPKVEATCFSCMRTSAVDNLLLYTVYEYSATSIGTNAALFGLDALYASILQTDLTLFTTLEFKKFLAVEKDRCSRYKSANASICFIHFENLDAFFEKMGKHTEQVFKEISAIFKSVFRKTDIITARNESLFTVLMLETSLENSLVGVERLQNNLNALFENSVNVTVKAKVKSYSMDEIADLDTSIETFLASKDD